MTPLVSLCLQFSCPAFDRVMIVSGCSAGLHSHYRTLALVEAAWAARKSHANVFRSEWFNAAFDAYFTCTAG